MALKRLMMAALGALGLSALAAGTASADQIPAPRLYGDITNCVTSPLTSVTRAMGRTASVLDRVFEQTPAVIDTARQLGSGANAVDVRAALLARITNPCAAGDSSNDIARGFAEARRIYNNVEGLRGAASGDNPTQRAIDDFNDALAKQEAYGGAVYDAVYSEEAAWKATSKAIGDWNSLFVGDDPVYTNALAGYGAIDIDSAALQPDDLATTTIDESASNDYNPYGRDMIKGFQAIGSLAAAADEAAIVTAVDATPVNDRSTAFDTDGNLQFAQGFTRAQTTNDIDDSVASTSDINTLSEIVAHLDAWQAAVDSAQDTLDDANPETVDLAPLQQRLAKLEAGRNHVRDELTRLTRVARAVNPNVDHDSDAGTAAVSAVSLLDGYETALGELRATESRIRGAAGNLEAARNLVKERLENADSYLSQLVRLREFEKQDLLDRYDGSPPESALEAADEALDRARMQQTAHASLAGEADNPANVLLNELVKARTNADGDVVDDDGQALITAISDTYNVAKGAADQAREVVDELTGEGGQVAMNTAAISENADNITALDGRVTQNEEDIASNTTMIGENRGMIMANTAGIAENRGMIMANTAGIAENRGMIMTNADEIVRVEGRVDTNWDAIAANQTAIETNSGRISSNADAIAANMNSIGSNSSAISDNRNMIGELSDDLDVVRAGVAASMALAGMPAINGRGISIGVGSFDGESAFAVGFQIQGEMASFKVGVTSASGATGASAGVGFQF